MPEAVAVLALLLVNLAAVAIVFVRSPSPTRPRMRSATGPCVVCSAPDPETTVQDRPVCTACKDEYFDAGA